MKRHLLEPVHEEYRLLVRQFMTRTVEPRHAQWERAGCIERDVFAEAAEKGIYGLSVPMAYGGSGETDFRYRVVVNEETARIGATSFSVTLSVQDDLVLAYLLDLATNEQQDRWLRPFAEGQLIGALAMSEPGTGSDLRNIRTRADRIPGVQGEWLLSGQKTFISCATTADVVIVAARTQSNDELRTPGLSLFVVEYGMEGFTRGRRLDKVGLRAQDTGELFFDNVHLTEANLLGTEGRGLSHLISHLPRERLGVMASSLTMARAVYEETVRYCRDRTAFGKPVSDFQNTRFVLAELLTELDVAEAFFDKSVIAYNAGEFSPLDAAKGKLFLTELQKRLVDRCVQLHGGYGYMLEYPVARAFIDGRAQTIYGGTSEIMKEIIGRAIADDAKAT